MALSKQRSERARSSVDAYNFFQLQLQLQLIPSDLHGSTRSYASMRSIQRLWLLGRLRSRTDLHDPHYPALSAWPLHRRLVSSVASSKSTYKAIASADRLVPTSVPGSELDGGSQVTVGKTQYSQPSPGRGADPVLNTHHSGYTFSATGCADGKANSSHSRSRNSNDNSSTRLYCSKGGDKTSDLWPEQKTAALDFSKRVVRVTAGPGSGKTRVLIARIKSLVEKQRVRPESIAVVTYSRKAAADLVLRIREAVSIPGSGANEMFVGTFHGLSSKLVL